MEPIYFEEYKLNHKRKSYGRTVTEADIVLHAGQSGDFYPHHMDKEWCSKQEFGQRIAHGTLIFSIAVGASAILINPVAFTYGYDKLRFIKPIYIGDTIYTETEVTSTTFYKKKDGYGIVTESAKVINQKGETVMVFDHLLMVEKKKPK